MVYTKTAWQDNVVEYPNRYVQVVNGDGTVTLTKSEGNVVQAGTPLSATKLNNAEQGIADAHAQLDGAARQTQTLLHGTSVLNGGVDSPVNIQIEGRTLIPQQNNVLDATKLYVLADKKKKLKWADASLTTGVAKFTGKAERPTIIHTSNFENKVAASTLENPHTSKPNPAGNETTLLTPSQFTAEVSQLNYTNVMSLNSTTSAISSSLVNGAIAQRLSSFDLIQAVERQIGRIPRNTTAEKVQWLKDNIAKLTCNWHGYGSSVGGNRATLSSWNGSSWTSYLSVTTSTVSKIGAVYSDPTQIANRIQSDGFVHFLAYADASDGVTASTINTDYVELEIEMSPSAILHDPRVPLYEVPQTSYDAILVTWLEDEVLRRYPQVAGVQHIQNPYVMAEGENLIPPFSEWVLHANAVVNSPYDMTLNANGAGQYSTVTIRLKANQPYFFSYQGSPEARFYRTINNLDGSNKLAILAILLGGGTWAYTPTADELLVLSAASSTVGTHTFTNPMLTLGTVAKPFVPRNPSYLLAETKLGALNGVYDRLYEQDGKYMVRKMIEKDVVLDGSLAWTFHSDLVGYKFLKAPFSNFVQFASYVSKYDGKIIKNITNTASLSGDEQSLSSTDNTQRISVSDTDTGFGEHYKPSVAEIQAYFNGWKATGYAGTAVTAEASALLGNNGTYTFLQNGAYKNVVVTKSTDNTTFTTAVEGTDFTIDISGTKAVLKNINVGALYFKIDYLYGVTVNAWQSIIDGSAPTVQTSAFVSNVVNKLTFYTPYKLSYQLATPVISEARTEGSISVNGLTQVEVGSGVIVREKIVPQTSGGVSSYYINQVSVGGGVADAPFKNRVLKILKVFKNDQDETGKWLFTSSGAYGAQRGYMDKTLYDATAEYYATYIVYDKNIFTNNVINLLAQYANNIRTALDDTVKKVEDNQTAIAVNTNLIYDILKRLKAGGI